MDPFRGRAPRHLAAVRQCGASPPLRDSRTRVGIIDRADEELWMKNWGKSAVVVTLSAAGILMVTMGARQSLGLFVSPLNGSTGLGITTISLALAVGQLMWGAIQPVAGAIADRYGPGKVLVAGLIVLSIGTALTPFMTSGLRRSVTVGLNGYLIADPPCTLRSEHDQSKRCLVTLANRRGNGARETGRPWGDIATGSQGVQRDRISTAYLQWRAAIAAHRRNAWLRSRRRRARTCRISILSLGRFDKC